MEKYIHIYVENHKYAKWRRYYRMNHGMIMEWGTSGQRGAGRRPEGRVVKHWSNEETKEIVKSLMNEGWEKWPDPWKDDIQHQIKLEVEKREILKRKEEQKKKEALKKMSKRGKGGKNRLQGL